MVVVVVVAESRGTVKTVTSLVRISHVETVAVEAAAVTVVLAEAKTIAGVEVDSPLSPEKIRTFVPTKPWWSSPAMMMMRSPAKPLPKLPHKRVKERRITSN